MTFQRARTEEQRGQRRRQILDAAAAMLTEMPVARLSLNELSRRVGLAKANVLRYFPSREAVLLELLDAEVEEWVAELERGCPPGEGDAWERADRLADALAASMVRRPVLCDLSSAQGAVLEHNISVEVAVRHKRAAHRSLRRLTELLARHLPEIGAEGAAVLVESLLLTAMAAWQCDRPSDAMVAAYASDPELAAMRVDFTDVVRRAVKVTAAGLVARREAGARP